jgi:hypothetical protein
MAGSVGEVREGLVVSIFLQRAQKGAAGPSLHVVQLSDQEEVGHYLALLF